MKKLRGEVAPFENRYAKNPGWMTHKIPRARRGDVVRFEIDGRTFEGIVKKTRLSQMTVESNGSTVRIEQGDVTAIKRSWLK